LGVYPETIKRSVFKNKGEPGYFYNFETYRARKPILYIEDKDNYLSTGKEHEMRKHLEGAKIKKIFPYRSGETERIGRKQKSSREMLMDWVYKEGRHRRKKLNDL